MIMDDYKPKYTLAQLQEGALVLLFVATGEWEEALQGLADFRYYANKAYLESLEVHKQNGTEPPANVTSLYEETMENLMSLEKMIRENMKIFREMKNEIAIRNFENATMDDLAKAIIDRPNPDDEEGSFKMRPAEDSKSILLTADNFQDYLGQIRKVRLQETTSVVIQEKDGGQ